MKTYSFKLEGLLLYPRAEQLLGRYMQRTIPFAHYSEQHRQVYHDRRISKAQQAAFNAYIAALRDADVGAP
jgi:hypothetical protein